MKRPSGQLPPYKLMDYLINVGDCKYSVPYEFIGKKVDIRTTDNSIEVHNNRIASHVRKSYSLAPFYLPRNTCLKIIENILNIALILSLNGQKVFIVPHSLL